MFPLPSFSNYQTRQNFVSPVLHLFLSSLDGLFWSMCFNMSLKHKDSLKINHNTKNSNSNSLILWTNYSLSVETCPIAYKGRGVELVYSNRDPNKTYTFHLVDNFLVYFNLQVPFSFLHPFVFLSNLHVGRISSLVL